MPASGSGTPDSPLTRPSHGSSPGHRGVQVSAYVPLFSEAPLGPQGWAASAYPPLTVPVYQAGANLPGCQTGAPQGQGCLPERYCL